jgi:hypothetical protein
VPPPAASPAPPVAALSPGLREEIRTLVRAAVDEAVAPLHAKQRALEARLERAEAGTRGAAATGSIPVAVGSIAPPAFAAPSPARPIGGDPLSDDVTPRLPPVASGKARSIPPSGYGVVVPPKVASRDLDLSNVGPIDVPDFGGSRRVGKVLVALIILVVIVLAVMTVLSHS